MATPNKVTISLLAIALAARIATAMIHMTLGLLSIPSAFPISTWADFQTDYAAWFSNVGHGMIPYKDFLTYTYTPLYLYILYPFYALGGISAATIPVIVSDAGSSVLIYLSVNDLKGKRVGLIAGLAYAFSPFALFNEGYLWMSSQPMTFFMLLAVYFLHSRKPIASALALGLAVMTKQEALFMLPAYAIFYLRDYRSSTTRGVIAFATVVLGVSLPFLLISPWNYLSSLNYLKQTLPPGTRCTSQIVQQVTIALCNGISPSLSSITNSLAPLTTSPTQAAGFPLEFIITKTSEIVSPLLLVVLLPALYVSRGNSNSLPLLSVYSISGLLSGYALLGHPIFNYYFVPTYALLMLSSTDYRTLMVGAVAQVAGLFWFPEGAAQVLMSLVAILMIISLQDSAVSAVSTSSKQGTRNSRAGRHRIPRLQAWMLLFHRPSPHLSDFVARD